MSLRTILQYYQFLSKRIHESSTILMAFLYQKTVASIHSPSSIKALAIIFFIFIFQSVAAITLMDTNKTIPAVFSFGDSILDTGINNYFITLAKANFPPYGQDFIAGKPTGRFSNGKLPTDFIAEGLGVKEIVPAYLDPNLQLQDLLTGVNFASGGSGYDDLTATIRGTKPLLDQLELFKEYKNKITAAVGNETTATLLSKSVFILSSGSNDIANSYFTTRLRRFQYDIPAYTDFMIELASNSFQELYALGARIIGVLSVLPSGCFPIQRTLFGGIRRACYETENQGAILFNSKLSSLIDSLNKKLPEAQLIYLDFYNPLLSLVQNPAQQGFEVVDKGCCGTGTIGLGPLCNELSPLCANVSKYIFWDSVHPTEKAYRIITSMFLEQLKI